MKNCTKKFVFLTHGGVPINHLIAMDVTSGIYYFYINSILVYKSTRATVMAEAPPTLHAVSCMDSQKDPETASRAQTVFLFLMRALVAWELKLQVSDVISVGLLTVGAPPTLSAHGFSPAWTKFCCVCWRDWRSFRFVLCVFVECPP